MVISSDSKEEEVIAESKEQEEHVVICLFDGTDTVDNDVDVFESSVMSRVSDSGARSLHGMSFPTLERTACEIFIRQARERKGKDPSHESTSTDHTSCFMESETCGYPWSIEFCDCACSTPRDLGDPIVILLSSDLDEDVQIN